MKRINRPFASLKDQSGINMVDLMMWLVIAALLLAAAIQSIGYYQKAAHLNNMKFAAHAVGTNALAVAANEDGMVTESVVSTAAADTNWTEGTSYSVENTNGTPYVRVTDPSVPDQEVIYLFESCGDEYVTGANVVPVGGTTQLQECGVAAAAPAGGGSGSSGSSYTVGETSDAIAYTPITDVAAGMNPEVIQYLNTELRAYADKTVQGVDWDAFDATPAAQEYYATYPKGTGAADYIDYVNITERADDPNVTALANAYWESDTAYWDAVFAEWDRQEVDPTAIDNPSPAMLTAQRNIVDAMSAWYRAAAAIPMPSAPMVPTVTGGFNDRTIAAGSKSTITIDFKTPDSLNVAGDPARFKSYWALYQPLDATSSSTWSSEYQMYGTANSPTSMTLQAGYQGLNGVWGAGKSELLFGVKDTNTNIIYYSTVKLTVQ